MSKAPGNLVSGLLLPGFATSAMSAAWRGGESQGVPARSASVGPGRRDPTRHSFMTSVPAVVASPWEAVERLLGPAFRRVRPDAGGVLAGGAGEAGEAGLGAPPRPDDRRSVAVVCFGDLGREPRVDRQIGALRGHYRVIGVGFAPSRYDDVDFVPVRGEPKGIVGKLRAAMQLLGRRYEAYYWGVGYVRDLVSKLRALDVDVIIAHDIDTLPAVVRHARGARILLDAHDYAPRQFEDRLFFRLFLQRYRTWLCKTYIPRVDRMITVCDGLADAYRKDTGVASVVITNARDYIDLEPKLRDPSERKIRLIHHGAAIRSRKLEGMIRAMDYLDDRFELDLMLVENSPRYVDELRKMAQRRPNVRILPPVPMPDIPVFLNRYDVGVFLLEPVNFNYRFALPNKLFEFVQARLGVAVSPSPEMARIVRQHGCGVVAEGFSPKEFAACLRDLGHDRINDFKLRAHEAAGVLSSEKNKARLIEIVGELMEMGKR